MSSAPFGFEFDRRATRYLEQDNRVYAQVANAVLRLGRGDPSIPVELVLDQPGTWQIVSAGQVVLFSIDEAARMIRVSSVRGVSVETDLGEPLEPLLPVPAPPDDD